MLAKPLLECGVHASLPTGAASAERCQYLRIEPDRYLLLDRILVLSPGTAKSRNGRCNTSAGRHRAAAPVDSVGTAGRRRCSLGGSNLLGTKDFQSRLQLAIGLHSDMKSNERRGAAQSTP